MTWMAPLLERNEQFADTDTPGPAGTDVERLLTSPLLSLRVSVTGHVYDTATGRVMTVDARYP